MAWEALGFSTSRPLSHLLKKHSVSFLSLIFFFKGLSLGCVPVVSPGDPSVVDIRSLFFSGHGGWLHSTSGPSTDASSMHLLFNSQNWCLHFESFECY